MNWNTNANTKKAGETRTYIVSFAEKLREHEALTGTPTATELRTSALTITDVDLTVEDWTIMGRRIKAYTAVVFSVSGGTARNDYTIRVEVGTDTSPVQTLQYDMRLKVE